MADDSLRHVMSNFGNSGKNRKILQAKRQGFRNKERKIPITGDNFGAASSQGLKRKNNLDSPESSHKKHKADIILPTGTTKNLAQKRLQNLRKSLQEKRIESDPPTPNNYDSINVTPLNSAHQNKSSPFKANRDNIKHSPYLTPNKRSELHCTKKSYSEKKNTRTESNTRHSITTTSTPIAPHKSVQHRLSLNLTTRRNIENASTSTTKSSNIEFTKRISSEKYNLNESFSSSKKSGEYRLSSNLTSRLNSSENHDKSNESFSSPHKSLQKKSSTSGLNANNRCNNNNKHRKTLSNDKYVDSNESFSSPHKSVRQRYSSNIPSRINIENPSSSTYGSDHYDNHLSFEKHDTSNKSFASPLKSVQQRLTSNLPSRINIENPSSSTYGSDHYDNHLSFEKHDISNKSFASPLKSVQHRLSLNLASKRKTENPACFTNSSDRRYDNQHSFEKYDNSNEYYSPQKSVQQRLSSNLTSSINMENPPCSTSNCSNVEYSEKYNNTNESFTSNVHPFEEYEVMEWSPVDEEKIIENISEIRKEIQYNDQLSTVNYQSEQVVNIKNSNGVFIVVDTNIFLSNLNFITELKSTHFKDLGPTMIVVPWMVIQELDYMKDGRSCSRSLTSSSSKAVSYINNCLIQKDPNFRGQNVTEASQQVLTSNNPDDGILFCCLQLAKQGKMVVLLSNDKNLRNKALVNSLMSYSKDDIVSSLKNYAATSEKPTRSSLQSVTKVKLVVSNMLTNIIETEMKKAYGDIWMRMAGAVPPLTVEEAVECIIKYWVAVFSFNLLKQCKQVVDEFKIFLSRIGNGDMVNKEDHDKYIEFCLKLCIYLKNGYPEYKNNVCQAIQNIQNCSVQQ